MRVPGFARLYAGLLLGRVSGTMVTVALVLFVLTRYHSPQLAGATAFFAIFPGLLVSPLAGALLDRKGRSRLVVLDYALAAAAVGLIAGLSALHSLPPVLLVIIVGVSSLTNPLSTAGARTLFPILVPEELWERANGLDSSGHVFSTLVGAPLAGTLVGWIGGAWALAAAGVLFVAAAVVMLGLPDPPAATESHGNIFRNAWLGLKFVAQNSTLRGLAFTLSFLNFGWGVIDIAVPVLLLGRLHQGPAVVGYLWGGLGAAGLVSALLAGRVPTQGRERQIMVGGIIVTAVAMATLPFATSVVAVAIVLVVLGTANGPFDISFFTLRQRRTPPAWFGRAFAVSMSLNFVGTPIGSALAGTLIERSLDVALWTAVAVVLVAGIFPMLTIPASEKVAASAEPAT
ncbi:MAG TPA: MFS transporter [Candidatus Dormibacteraeota bacterium]|nr:MFS transporter [Candidatus Dormibacteraeota bacterium]